MKTRKNPFTRGARVLSFIMALLMMVGLLAVPAFATQVTADVTSTAVTYRTLDDYGRLMFSVDSSRMRSDWDKSGCALHGQFDYDCAMRRLRLTFYNAYNLPIVAQELRNVNTYDGVLNLSCNGQTLRSMLSYTTIEGCRGKDGIQTLGNVKQYPEYRSSYWVRQAVDGLLQQINGGTYTAKLRQSLAYFFPEAMLARMSASQLLEMSDLIVAMPEYIAWHNALYGHDCYTVNNLLRQGYGVSYIADAYTRQAITATQRIWPDYLQWEETYRTWTHAW